MTQTTAPVVVIVDDDESQQIFAESLDQRVEAFWRHPLDVDENDLSRATLLAVDERFDLRGGQLPEDVDPLPDGLPPATVPRDGIALAAVLRSASKHPDLGRTRPIGITLRTGALDELTEHLPQAVRQPVIASQHDLEWVLTKEAVVKDAAAAAPRQQLVALALALADYPSRWPRSTVRDVGLNWLGLPDTEWSSTARRQVLQSRPPVLVSSDAAHGLSWLRWLTSRVLPYPTFVISDHYAAAALGVTIASLQTSLQDEESWLAGELSKRIYDGPLSELQPRRYWRAGISHFVASLVDDLDVEDTQVIAEALMQREPALVPVGSADPVVGVDVNYYPLPDLLDRSEAARLSPDYWPAFADAAWTSPSLAADPKMIDLLAPTARG